MSASPIPLLVPALPREVRVLGFKVVGRFLVVAALFSTAVWSIQRPHLWFPVSAIFVALSSVFIYLLIGQLAFAQTKRSTLRAAYLIFGVTMPIACTLFLGEIGLFISVSIELATLLILPTQAAAGENGG